MTLPIMRAQKWWKRAGELLATPLFRWRWSRRCWGYSRHNSEAILSILQNAPAMSWQACRQRWCPARALRPLMAGASILCFDSVLPIGFID